MLIADIKGCTDCDSISRAICSIDAELTELSYIRRDNERFDLGRIIDYEKIEALITYRRILQRKYRNPDYMGCCGVQLGDIISRVKTLAIAKPKTHPSHTSIGEEPGSLPACD